MCIDFFFIKTRKYSFFYSTTAAAAPRRAPLRGASDFNLRLGLQPAPRTGKQHHRPTPAPGGKKHLGGFPPRGRPGPRGIPPGTETPRGHPPGDRYAQGLPPEGPKTPRNIPQRRPNYFKFQIPLKFQISDFQTFRSVERALDTYFSIRIGLSSVGLRVGPSWTRFWEPSEPSSRSEDENKSKIECKVAQTRVQHLEMQPKMKKKQQKPEL